MFIESVLTERFKAGDHRDGMVRPLLDHSGSLAPISGEWIKLQDLIVVGARVLSERELLTA